MAEYDWSDARKGIEAIRAWLSSVGSKPEFEPLGKRVKEASEAIPESTKEALRALSPTATRLRDMHATEQETHAAGLRSGRIAEGEEKARDYLSRERHTAALERLAVTTQSERSSEKATVSDHDPPETPTKAARTLIGWFAGGLAFQCIETLHTGYWPSLGYGIGAIVVAIFDYKLPAILSPRLTKSLNQVAADARLWVAVAITSLLIISLSPYIEQNRWPFAWQLAAPVTPSTEPLFTQGQVNEKIAAAVANLNSQLTEANRQRDAAQREANAFRQQIQNAPLPKQNYDSPRIYSEKTVQTLWDPCASRTPLQCDLLISDEKGKWIKATGRVMLVTPIGHATIVVGTSPNEHTVYCIFDSSVWKPKLSVFRPSETISVAGKIGGYNGATLILNDCELIQ